MRTKTLPLLLAVTLLLVNLSGFAQSWVKYNDDIVYTAMTATRDGNIVICADTVLSNATQPQWNIAIISKIDPTTGGYIWQKFYHDSLIINSIIETADSGFVAAAEVDQDSANLLFRMVRFDKFGNRLWQKDYSPRDTLIFGQTTHIIQNYDGGFTLVGGLGNYYQGIEGKYVVRTDANGDTLWTWWATNYDYFPWSVAETYDHGVVIAGSYSADQQLFIDKLDSTGHLQWERIYTTGTYSYRMNIVATPDNGFLLAGSGGEVPWTVPDNPFLMKVNANGDSLWSRLVNPGPEEIVSISPSADGGYWLLFDKEDSTRQIWVMKIDNQFDSVWSNVYHLVDKFFYARAIQALPNGGFAVAGFPYDTAAAHAQESKALLMVVGGINTFQPNVVKGHVYEDLNHNCIRDSGDIDLSNKLVQLSGTHPYYGASDLNGAYQIVADTGTYQLSYNDLDHLWVLDSCNLNALNVHFQSIFDTVTVDVPVKPLVQCPDLVVHLGAYMLRPCTNTDYFISYSNNGTQTADSAYIELELDPYLSYVSSSIPYSTQTGQTYRFDIGQVAPGASSGFTVKVLTSCTTRAGQTHCVTAHIYPDSSCFAPNPLWDKSDIEVKAVCINQDSVDLEIHNKGLGNMQSLRQYYIVEDNVMFKIGNFQLAAGASKHEFVPANGATWTLIAEQSEYHPGQSAPLISIEACGRNSHGGYSRGFVTQFPLDDQDDFVDIECKINSNSFDPNDKIVSPEGLTTFGYISKDQPLEYHIDFQNTGTDTAFRVVVRDTLSNLLDITTLQLGPSSHAYAFAIRDSNVLEWTFDPIALADSNVNEPASHGFVSFGIHQKPNNQPGDVILNQAAIYFDFNDAVITNTTLNTIEDDYKQWLSVEEVANSRGMARLYPNPTKGNITLLLQGVDNEQAIVLSISDLSGRQLKTYTLQGNGLHTITGLNLQQGMYLYQITTDTQQVATGKIVVFE